MIKTTCLTRLDPIFWIYPHPRFGLPSTISISANFIRYSRSGIPCIQLPLNLYPTYVRKGVLEYAGTCWS